MGVHVIPSGATGQLIFNDVMSSLKQSVAKLKEEEAARSGAQANIIIAVGHAGFEVDQLVAKEVDDVDIVVGGHTNTFLWSGALYCSTSRLYLLAYPSVSNAMQCEKVRHSNAMQSNTTQ